MGTGLNYTNTKLHEFTILHEGTQLHENKIAQVTFLHESKKIQKKIKIKQKKN